MTDCDIILLVNKVYMKGGVALFNGMASRHFKNIIGTKKMNQSGEKKGFLVEVTPLNQNFLNQQLFCASSSQTSV